MTDTPAPTLGELLRATYLTEWERESVPGEAIWQNIAEHFLAAVRGDGEPVAWRPIETAPKDGTPVLLIALSAYTPTPFEGWWVEDGQWGVKGAGWVEPKMSGGVRKWFPTHWMPKEALLTHPAPKAGDQVEEIATIIERHSRRGRNGAYITDIRSLAREIATMLDGEK